MSGDVGVVNVVVVTAQGSSVFRFSRRWRDTSPGAPGTDSVARNAWSCARSLLPRLLPALLGDLPPPLSETDRPYRHRGSFLKSDGDPALIHTVRGESLGAAFLLAQVSELIEVPVPDDLVVSARITSSAELGPVEGLDAKAAAAATAIGEVGKFIVFSPSEKAVVEEGLDTYFTNHSSGSHRWTVIACNSAAELLECVFGESLLKRIELLVNEPGRVPAIAQDLFDSAVAGRSKFVDWGPVARGASLALQVDSTPETRFRLEFTRVIADRHRDHETEFPVPPQGLVESLQYEEVLAIARNVEQHAADFGNVTGGLRAQLVVPFLPRVDATAIRSCPPLGLRLLGAHGRFLAAEGRTAEALDLQEKLMKTWVARREAGDATYPIAECLRLSGLHSSDERYTHALDQWHALESDPRLAAEAPRTVGAARLRGALLLRRRPEEILSLGREWLRLFGAAAGVYPKCLVLRTLLSPRVGAHLDPDAAAWRAELRRCAEPAAQDPRDLHAAYAQQCLYLLLIEEGDSGALGALRADPMLGHRFERLDRGLTKDGVAPALQQVLDAWPY